MDKDHHGDSCWQVSFRAQFWAHFFFSSILMIYPTDERLVQISLLMTSVFTIFKDKNESGNVLNNYLSLISKWAFHWKMLFNLDPHKPAQEVLFSRKKEVSIHPVTSLSKIQVEKELKHHIDNKLCKVTKGTAVIKKLRHALLRESLLTI